MVLGANDGAAIRRGDILDREGVHSVQVVRVDGDFVIVKPLAGVFTGEQMRWAVGSLQGYSVRGASARHYYVDWLAYRAFLDRFFGWPVALESGDLERIYDLAILIDGLAVRLASVDRLDTRRRVAV